MVTSKSGLFYYKANAVQDYGETCGLYLITDPGRRIEIELTHLDVSCQDGGLLSMVDGWEMGGEYFPSPDDHPLALTDRVISECGNRQTKKLFVSSQNAALVQYRVASHGQGFSLRVRYPKNPKPCNILVEDSEEVYTLSNYGQAMNCSVTTLFSATISIVGLNVGPTMRLGFDHSLPRSSRPVSLKCEDQNPRDYLQIGGSFGLDTTNMMVAGTYCGTVKNLRRLENTIACGTTTVRLVSSGQSANVARVAIRRAEDEDLASASLDCSA